MGRPKIQIDEMEVEKLAAMHCSAREIAAFFSVSVDTIDRRFADTMAKGRQKGRAKLRRLQWEAAVKGNVVMQIWLGKNLLGQSDKQEQDITVTGALTVGAMTKAQAQEMLDKIENEKQKPVKVE